MNFFCVCTCVSWLPPPLAFRSEMTLGTAHFSLLRSLGLSSSDFQFPFSPGVSPLSLPILWLPHCPHVLPLELSPQWRVRQWPCPVPLLLPRPWTAPWREGVAVALSLSLGGFPPLPLHCRVGPAPPQGPGRVRAACGDAFLNCVCVRMLGRKPGEAGGCQGPQSGHTVP